MKLYHYFLVFLCIHSLTMNAQDYFQQEVNYNIQVKLDDELHTLSAFEEIEYINNSPDELAFIMFHIWPNAYKNNQTALGQQKLKAGGKRKYLNDPKQGGYIDSLDFKIDEKTIKWEYDSDHIDICKLYLSEPLKPGGKITISTPFYVKLPKGNMSRLGHLNQSYQITQWFPKPAVYDLNGWNAMPYLDIGEFYYEYGSFHVEITVPKNYVVAATGNLKNEDEINWIKENYNRTSEINEFDLADRDFPKSSNETKTLIYEEKNVHDFAWFADKRFNVLKGRVELPNTKKIINTWVYFPNHEADLWKDALEYVNDALYYYSSWYGDYAYDNCTAVHVPGSRGGMEYPGITIIGNNPTPMSLEMVVMHEVGHNWFQGMLGTNEREHPWMDEGINTFSEIRYFNTKYPDNRLYPMQLDDEKKARFVGIDEFPFAHLHQFFYRFMARRNLDVPTNSCSTDLSGLNYSAMAYSKTGLCFYYLMNYLGEETFNKIMQEYFDTWKFKHPQPKDLRVMFEKETKQDLSWFFDDLIGSDKKMDYGISGIKKNRIHICNHGQVTSPIPISFINENGEIIIQWEEGFSGRKEIELSGSKGARDIKIFGYEYPELQPKNNFISERGIFKKTERLKARLVGALEKPDNTTFNFLPAFGWNYQNGFMLGTLAYSDILPTKKFEYQVMPFYSFGSNDLAGLFEFKYNIHPYSNLIQRVSLRANGKQFNFDQSSGNYYQKVAAGIDIRFKRKENKIPIDKTLTLNFIYAHDHTQLFLNERSFTNYYQAIFHQKNRRSIDPYEFSIEIQGGEGFTKTMVDASFKHHYIYKNSLDLRFFGGVFISQDESISPVYHFFASGTNGLNDYLYDNHYLARLEDPGDQLYLSNQFSPNQGGLAAYYSRASSNEYLLALNIASSLPISKNIPIQFYLNLAQVGENQIDEEILLENEFLYEGGVKLQIIRNVVELYAPLIMTDDMDNYLDDITKNYFQRMRFTLNFSELNIFDKARELK